MAGKFPDSLTKEKREAILDRIVEALFLVRPAANMLLIAVGQVAVERAGAI